MKWDRALIGDSKFSRLYDDQIGITIPAAVLAGNPSRDMKSMDIYLRVFHNYILDGRHEDWRGYFVNWWKRNANTTFPEASGQCFVDISGYYCTACLIKLFRSWGDAGQIRIAV